jgi:hypothetical protein
MGMNRVQFQQGMSMPEFLSAFGTEAQCTRAVEQALWPSGYRCPRCEATTYCMVLNNGRPLFQCSASRR